MRRMLHCALFTAALALGLGAYAVAQVTPVVPAIVPVTYALLNNASATGTAQANVLGGDYLFDVRGTFNGATVNLNVTVSDGTYITLQAITLPGVYGPYSIGAGTTAQAVVAGGPPSALNARLEGVGP